MRKPSSDKELIRNKLLSNRDKQEMSEDELEDKSSLDPWSVNWVLKEGLLKRQSIYSAFSSLKIRQYIVKGGDDLRQEVVAMQVISKMASIFKEDNLRLYLRPY